MNRSALSTRDLEKPVVAELGEGDATKRKTVKRRGSSLNEGEAFSEWRPLVRKSTGGFLTAVLFTGVPRGPRPKSAPQSMRTGRSPKSSKEAIGAKKIAEKRVIMENKMSAIFPNLSSIFLDLPRSSPIFPGCSGVPGSSSTQGPESWKTISLEIFSLAWKLQYRLKMSILTFRIPHRKNSRPWWVAYMKFSFSAPRKGRKIGAAQKLSKSVENCFWHVSTIFDVYFFPCAKNVEICLDTFWRFLTWPLSAGPSCGLLIHSRLEISTLERDLDFSVFRERKCTRTFLHELFEHFRGPGHLPETPKNSK